MALPNPPTTPNASKLHYLLWDNAATNAAAIWHSVKEITVNSETVGVAHVGTHVLAATLGGTDAIVVIAGTDSGTIRALAVNADGEVGIHDGGNSLTVDALVGTPVFVRLSDGTAAITTLPVSVAGTIAVTQSGTWTVQPGNTANTTAWLVTGTGGTFPVTDSGGSLTVDNAGTFAVQATLAAGSANIGDVDVLTVPAPLSTTGGGTEATALRVTLANDSTGLVSVDDNGASLTVDAPVGTPVFVRLSDGTAAITTLPVSLAASVAVTNADLTTLAGAVRAEDAASGNAQTGIPALVIQQSSPADTATTNGDYTFLQVSAGRLWASATIDAALPTGANVIGAITQSGTWNVTNISGTVSLPTGAATQATLANVDTNVAAAAASLSVLDDWDETNRAAVNTIAGQVGVQGASGVANALTQRVVLATDVALPTGSNTIGAVNIAAAQTIAVTNAGTFAVQSTIAAAATSIGKAEDAAHVTGDVGVPALAVRSNTAASTSGTDGDYQPLITNTTGHLWVDASGQTLTVGSHAVTNAGTFAVQAAITAASGSIASGAVASGAFASGALASGSIAAGAIAAGATSIAANEDDASADLDRGVKILAVRQATPANSSGTDGDYEMLKVSAGKLWIQGTYAEDAAHTTADVGMQMLAVQQTTQAALAGTTGDYAPLQVDQIGYLRASTAKRSSVTTMISAVAFDSASETSTSSALTSPAPDDYTSFALSLVFTRAGTGVTANLRVIVQWSNDGGTTWFEHGHAPFVDIYMTPDAIGASGVNEMLTGPILGGQMRIHCVSASCDGTNNITLTAKVQLLN